MLGESPCIYQPIIYIYMSMYNVYGQTNVAEIIIFARQLCFAAARFRRSTMTLKQLYMYVPTLLLLCPCVVFSGILYIPLADRGRAAHHRP